MSKNQKGLNISNKILRGLIPLFISGCVTFLVSDAILVIHGQFFGITIFIISFFIVFFVFLYKKFEITPNSKINSFYKEPEMRSPSDINNPSNPFAYTTPGGIGYRPFETGLEHHHKNSPFSDLDNYNNRF